MRYPALPNDPATLTATMLRLTVAGAITATWEAEESFLADTDGQDRRAYAEVLCAAALLADLIVTRVLAQFPSLAAYEATRTAGPHGPKRFFPEDIAQAAIWALQDALEQAGGRSYVDFTPDYERIADRALELVTGPLLVGAPT